MEPPETPAELADYTLRETERMREAAILGGGLDAADARFLFSTLDLYRSMIVAQSAEAARLEADAAPQWVSVEERLPGARVEVLVMDADGHGLTIAAINSNGVWVNSREGWPLMQDPLFWTPLPPPPAE